MKIPPAFRVWPALLLCGWAVIVAAADPAPAAPPVALRVFAAASLQEAIQDIAKDYEAATKVAIKGNFASSSTLAKQLEQGQSADVFLSANVAWMEYVAKRKLILDKTRSSLLGNELVLVVPADRPMPVRLARDFDFPRALKTRLALGDPDHVPAGIYGKQALQALGWWDALKDRLAPGADVRAALRLVELGEVDAGIVYATDAAASKKVKVAGVFPPETCEKVEYQVACGLGASPAALDFLAYLHGPKAAEVFRRYGFTILTAAPAKP